MAVDRNRQATYGDRVIDYHASSSEVALEGICEYFGMTLERAFVDIGNGVRLVRFSKPGIVKTPSGYAVMKFQHTRFSSENADRALEAFNSMRFSQSGRKLKPVGHKEFYEELRREDEEKGRNDNDIAIGRVTDNMFYHCLKIARWEKGAYIIAYEEKERREAERLAEKLEERRVHEVPEIREAMPRIRAMFNIRPIFFMGEQREDCTDIYDTLLISFPEMAANHCSSVRCAEGLANLNRERREGSTKHPQTALESRFSVYREIHSSVPRGQTFSFILAYMNKFLRDKEFW